MPFLTKTTISTSENASYAVYPALFLSKFVFVVQNAVSYSMQRLLCSILSHCLRISKEFALTYCAIRVLRTITFDLKYSLVLTLQWMFLVDATNDFIS